MHLRCRGGAGGRTVAWAAKGGAGRHDLDGGGRHVAGRVALAAHRHLLADLQVTRRGGDRLQDVGGAVERDGGDTVTLNSATNVLQSVTASASDLQVGQQVTVRGQRDSAGNVTAATIQVVPAGATFGGPGHGPAAGATPTP